jgi:hypothetical protein
MFDLRTLDGLEHAVKSAPPIRMRPSDIRAYRVRKLRRLLKRLSSRRFEGMQLFTPLPHAIPFLESTARWQLGDGSNQAAKTIHFAYKVAAILCGQDPTGRCPKNGGKALLVGLDGDHIGNPMWTKLAHEGAFDVIRDEITGQWRSVRPDPNNPQVLDPYDLAYKEKWRPAPPLLPERAIADIAWEDRAKGIPRNVKMRNGWEVLCRSSQGKPPQGIQLHLSWLDEEIANSQYFIPEVAARGMRFHAMNLWSATPQSGGDELFEFRERADAGHDDFQAFTFLLDDNPYMSPEDKRAFFETLSEEERDVRYYGHYLRAGRRIYPHYQPMGAHGCEPFVIPRDYCRELILDPGRTHCGTLFGAIDPDEQYCYVYDGFDRGHIDAEIWADLIDAHVRKQGGFQFARWIIDQQMGKQTRPGGAKCTARIYADALRKRGHTPQFEGPLWGFFLGTNDISAREECVLNWLTVRHEPPFIGTPRLQVFRGQIPKLDQQFRNARMDSKRPNKRADVPEDVLVCLEYWAGSNPVYQPPSNERAQQDDRLDAMLNRYMKKKRIGQAATSFQIG